MGRAAAEPVAGKLEQVSQESPARALAPHTLLPHPLPSQSYLGPLRRAQIRGLAALRRTAQVKERYLILTGLLGSLLQP